MEAAPESAVVVRAVPETAEVAEVGAVPEEMRVVVEVSGYVGVVAVPWGEADVEVAELDPESTVVLEGDDEVFVKVDTSTVLPEASTEATTDTRRVDEDDEGKIPVPVCRRWWR